MKNVKSKPSGFILVEALIAIAVFVITASALVSLILGSFNLVTKGADYSFASNISQEEVEALRSIKSDSWNKLDFEKSAIDFNGEWLLSGEGTEKNRGKFNSYINFSKVYRNNENEITGSSDDLLDVNSLFIESVVYWQENNKTLSISKKSFISNWESAIWGQSDWSGGDGQEVFVADNKYYSSTGLSSGSGLSLSQISTSSLETSGVIESSAFGPTSEGVFSSIEWEEELPEDCLECRILFQIKTAEDSGGFPINWSTWSGREGIDGDESDYFSNSDGEIINNDHNGGQWIKYRAELYGDGENSPSLKKVKIYYK